MTQVRNWPAVFQSGQDFTPLVIQYLQELEAELATFVAGGVQSVAAEDASIVVDGTADDPTIRTGTLDAIATQHPPVAAVALNAQKITGLAAGVNPTDAANVSQLPGAAPVSSVFTRTGAVTAQSGDYTAAQVGADASGAAAAAAAASLPVGSTLNAIATANATSADVALNSHKLTGLAAGTTAGDSVRYEQIPTALPPNGSAGGDLTGTYPSPTLAALGSATGPLGSATVTPIVTIDTKGRVTALSSATTVPTNAAGGDLTGNYPNPTLAAAGPGATGPLGGATVAPIVTIDAKGRVTALSSATITGGLAVFGDGSDGAITFNGTSTLLGIVPNPNSAENGVYTLARDVFLADGSALNSGISIKTNGYRVFCQGTFTNNGTIHWNGNAGAAQTTAGAELSNSTSSITRGTSGTAPGTAGGAGGTTTGSGGTGCTGVVSLGAVGGIGGTGTSGAGGAAGTQTNTQLAQELVPRMGINAALMAWFTAGTTTNPFSVNSIYGGTGGGGGGGDGTQGGGGGGGGGVVGVFVRTFAGTGAIQARGGNGGTPTAGARGGGGGGGGGVVVVISSSVSSGAISGQTIDANGGTKGSPHGGGSDNAANGSGGTVILLVN